MPRADRIRGRLIEIEIGEAKGLGWVAVGVVKEGLHHERGRLFEAEAADPSEAERQLIGEIEAYFA